MRTVARRRGEQVVQILCAPWPVARGVPRTDDAWTVPFTISHVAAVLPLTARPVSRWLPPTPLVIGAMAPDVPQTLGALALREDTHELTGAFGVDVVLTALGCLLWAYVLRPVVADL